MTKMDSVSWTKQCSCAYETTAMMTTCTRSTQAHARQTCSVEVGSRHSPTSSEKLLAIDGHQEKSQFCISLGTSFRLIIHTLMNIWVTNIEHNGL